jgi:hypothetical protein
MSSEDLLAELVTLGDSYGFQVLHHRGRIECCTPSRTVLLWVEAGTTGAFLGVYGGGIYHVRSPSHITDCFQVFGQIPAIEIRPSQLDAHISSLLVENVRRVDGNPSEYARYLRDVDQASSRFPVEVSFGDVVRLCRQRGLAVTVSHEQITVYCKRAASSVDAFEFWVHENHWLARDSRGIVTRINDTSVRECVFELATREFDLQSDPLDGYGLYVV